METRDKTIIKTSIIGIIVNIFLSAFKAVVGMLSNSIAIILDAVNNLSDALSSVITIVGTKLASKKPDRKHPLGHGRIEYLSAMLVAAIVLYAGITSLIESVKKIITPELVINVVAEHFNLTSSMIFSQNRSKEVAYPRQICMYLCKQLTPSSLGDIGKILGNRDHTTILHGYKKISTDILNDTGVKDTIDLLIKKLNPQE